MVEEGHKLSLLQTLKSRVDLYDNSIDNRAKQLAKGQLSFFCTLVASRRWMVYEQCIVPVFLKIFWLSQDAFSEPGHKCLAAPPTRHNFLNCLILLTHLYLGKKVPAFQGSIRHDGGM